MASPADIVPKGRPGGGFVKRLSQSLSSNIEPDGSAKSAIGTCVLVYIESVSSRHKSRALTQTPKPASASSALPKSICAGKFPTPIATCNSKDCRMPPFVFGNHSTP
ncbi:hypothetical protein PCANC_06990 [Puccinia coronata f. sp. avenae]|uniref:Uncharacterized protein n=1 Tax=Puccinia coronata f. sp. avenae TaxID=200324 RepID=A0A2N5UZK2_9BASI|nr:hypothetical protein PCANC_06990 [Puccinia coronata f. sp. avenae]